MPIGTPLALGIPLSRQESGLIDPDSPPATFLRTGGLPVPATLVYWHSEFQQPEMHFRGGLTPLPFSQETRVRALPSRDRLRCAAREPAPPRAPRPC
jgi:hypothetical protein